MSRTQEQIAVMQASLEGKPIECRIREKEGDPWDEVPDPVWNWSDYDYRVAAEPAKPRTWELAISQGSGSARVVEPGDSPSKLAWEIVRVVECPPGWKLVPPDKSRYFLDARRNEWKLRDGLWFVRDPMAGAWTLAAATPGKVTETDATGKPLHAANFGEVKP